MYTIDHTKKPQRISIFLAKPNRTIIGKIITSNNLNQKIRYGQVNELSLSIPYQITKNSKLNRNPIVDLIREKFLIKVVFGTSEEWYIINKKSKSMNDYDSISLECFSLAYELKYKKIIDFKQDSYNCLQVLTDCLKDTNWSIGYINPDFYLKYRQFDVSNKTKLDFIDEICDTFKGIATYDTVNKTVSIWKEEEISSYKGFWISYGKYLETIEETVSVDEIVTRLIVTPSETVSIESANPTGQSYIDDFSYFLYPFERNEDRKVISSSYFMSNELCHAILDYNQLINSNAEEFSGLLKTRKELETDITNLKNGMTSLKDDLQIILDNIEIAKKNKESTKNLLQQRDKKKNDINNKQSLINLKQAEIDSNVSEIGTLNELLKLENNIEGELLTELNYYIQEEEWSDDNQINDEDYFYAASDYLSTVSVPPINLSMSIVNFFDIVEEQHNWNRMGIGDIIRVKHPILRINVKTKITEIVFNYDEGTIDLTISNTKRPETIQQKLTNAFYKIDKLSTDYNKRKPNWELVATNFNTRNDRIKVTPSSPTVKDGAISHKLNDNGSVDLTVNWIYTNYAVSKNEADNIDGFIIFLYASNDNEDYSFGSNISQESMTSVSSEKRTFTFPSVPSNVYYSVGIKAYRNVDDDIAKDGVLFSNIITYPQYLPSPTMSIKSNMDAATVGGVVAQVDTAPNTIPVRDDTGVIQGSISGDAATLNGKSSTDFALLDTTGNVPVEQLGNITVAFTGTYTGDGTQSKQINIGFKPKIIKVYTTNIADSSIFIPSESGGFLMKNNSTTIYIEGEGVNKDNPSPTYGLISTTGFTTGNTTDVYLNKLNVIYYWEAVK